MEYRGCARVLSYGKNIQVYEKNRRTMGESFMSQEKEPESAPEANYAMTRRKLLIFLGIFLGIIIAGFSIIKEAGIKTINKFRIRSIEQTPSFDPDKWELIVEGLVNTPLAISYNELLGLENEEQMTDFHCVEGYWSPGTNRR